MQIKRLAIIGVGLIGGSLARALKRAGAVGEVVGCGRRAEDLQHGVELGVIDRYSTDPAQAVAGADMVLVATPVGSMRTIFGKIADHLSQDAIVTDAGSVKGSVITDARDAFGNAFVRFVPGHPIAGTEQSGIAASFADLYVGHRVILTPVTDTGEAPLQAVRGMWEAAGARVESMTAQAHDEILAYTSHLPHMVAYALVDCLGRGEPTTELLRFAAGGFRDITRIASSSAVMWRDIALANDEALLKTLEAYRDSIDSIVEAIRNGDGAALEAMFERARRTRESLAAANGKQAQDDRRTGK